MSQHDYDIANNDGATIRADLNALFEAMASLNAGASAPSVTFAYMFWADTGNDLLKIRNSSNNGWVTIGTLDVLGLALASLGANTFTGEQTFADNLLTGPWLKDWHEKVSVLGSISGAIELDIEDGNVFTCTITGATTFTFSNPAVSGSPSAGVCSSFAMRITDGGTDITWPANIKTPGGVALELTASGIDWVVANTVDGGATWDLLPAGSDLQTVS